LSTLNIAGPAYDFGSVVFAVLEECEHRRRGFERDELEFQMETVARKKLAQIKAAYDEFGGSPAYWKSLQTEVMETALPQYVATARQMNELERNSFGVWRSGDPAARITFGLGGLIVGGFVKALPFVPTIENMFVFALAAAGFLYPELKRYTHERRHARTLNHIVAEAVAYQANAKLHYMTSNDIRQSFAIGDATEEESAVVEEPRSRQTDRA
jgi:hypothetical protein